MDGQHGNYFDDLVLHEIEIDAGQHGVSRDWFGIATMFPLYRVIRPTKNLF